MDNVNDVTYFDLIRPGALGDEEIQVRLTARQMGALQLAISAGVHSGALGLAYSQALLSGIGPTFSLAYREAQARVGLVLAGVIAPDRRAEFSAELARLEQEKAAAEGTDGD